MQRWRGQDEIPTDWGRCVVTIGVFDGVHRGHAELISHAVKAGRSRGVPVVLMTFDPHPMEVVVPGSHPAQLTTLTRRAELVEELLDLLRRGQRRARALGLEPVVVGDDVVADLDALVTDEHGRACDELADVVLILVAEGAAQDFVFAGFLLVMALVLVANELGLIG